MSTPIEIVRARVTYLTNPAIYHFAEPEDKKRTDALAAVLRDAERYKALERAIDLEASDTLGNSLNEIEGRLMDPQFHYTLAELADKLRSETK